MLAAAVLGLLFDAYNSHYGLAYTTAERYQISVGSNRCTNTSLLTGEVVFDLNAFVSPQNSNFTLPSAYSAVANYNLAFPIVLAALTVLNLFLTATLTATARQGSEAPRLAEPSSVGTVLVDVSEPIARANLPTYNARTRVPICCRWMCYSTYTIQGWRPVAVVFCAVSAVQSCLALPLLVLFLHACHELTRDAVSWHIEQGGREILAGVCIVLTETAVAVSVSTCYWCTQKDSVAAAAESV